MLHKCRRIAPAYLASLLLYIAWYIAAPGFFPDSTDGAFATTVIRDMLCLQSTGLSQMWGLDTFRLNQHDWYISSFLYGGLIVYAFLKSGKNAIWFLATAVIMTYAAYFLVYDIGLNDEWGYKGIMYMPLWRGVAGMSLGAMVGMATSSQKFSSAYCRFIILNNVIAILCCIGIAYILFAPANHDFIAIILFALLVTNLVSPKGLPGMIKGRFMEYIPDISLEILLLHKFLIVVTVKASELMGILDITFAKYLLFIIILIISGIAFKYIVGVIETKIRSFRAFLPATGR